MKLIVTLRVKNAILFIDEWISCYENLADGIVVVDNGSTDGTLEKLRNCSKVIEIIETVGFDEGRDNKILLNMLKKYNPEWVLSVDSDEIFEKKITRETLDKYMNVKWVKHYKFILYNLFNDRNHFLADNFMLNAMMRSYGRSLYRYTNKLYVSDRKIHAGITGQSKFFIPTTARLLHLCFLHTDYRLKVYENYIKVDGNNKDNRKWYDRDINLIMNPSESRVFKLKNTKSDRIMYFFLFNIFYPYKFLKAILRR